MKKTFILILAAGTIWMSSCKKDAKKIPAGYSIDDSYIPLTAFSTWSYLVTGTDGNDTLTVKLTGAATVINGKTYYNANSTYRRKGSGAGYFFRANHLYGSLASNTAAGLSVEFEFLNDTTPTGESWISAPTDDGMLNGVPVRTVNTIKEVNVSKRVGDQTFTNVIHSEVNLQYNYGAGYENSAVYEFYFAKGVGMIEKITILSGDIYEMENIVSYNIAHPL